MEWDVRLEGVPVTERGKEVTVNFWSHDIDNGEEFYTDSNGLQMETRTLNFRPNFG